MPEGYFGPLPLDEGNLDFDKLLIWLGQQTIPFLKITDVTIEDADITSLSFDKITAATNTASLVVGGAGTVGSANYSAGTAGWQIEGDGSAEFNDVTLRGDLYSSNWDGTIPADLSSGPDTGASLGYYLDASAGAAQFTGPVYFQPPDEATPGSGAAMELGSNWSMRVYQDNPSVGEDTLWIHNDAGDGIDSLVLGPGAGAEHLKLIRLKGDELRVDGDAAVRFRIRSQADGGDITLNDFGGNALLLWDESDDRWEFSKIINWDGIAAGSSRQVVDFGEGYSVYADNTGSGTDNTRMWINTPDEGQLLIGPRAGDEDLHNIQIRSKSIDFDDGSTGAVEVWPKGTLITMGYASSTTDISDVSATEAELAATVQTIACDHASQPIYVDVTVTAVWRNLSRTTSAGIRPGVSGTAQGIQAIGGAGDTDAVDPGDTNSSGSQNLDNFGNTSTDSGHFHNVNSTSTVDADFAHAHTMGTHTHDIRPDRLTQTLRWAGEATADVSGDIALSIFGDGDGAMDIDAWSIAYAIWRR